jgi:hypothetical protein
MSKKFAQQLHKHISIYIYLFYEASDKDLAAMVTKKLKSKNKDLSIYTELLKFDENKIWQ